MEVDKTSFYPLLLDILTDISEAHFVAFDLELSGVVSKSAGRVDHLGRPTLQDRYLETKEAAERYQILQIGITCVQQDVDTQTYVLKPYNFNLNPLIEEQNLSIERVFSFQSSAVEFLLSTGFDISKPFREGVPYLSRSESREAREKHAKRQDRTAHNDIALKPTETASLAFLERVRGELNSWLSNTSGGYIDIGPNTAPTRDVDGDECPVEMSRFEKRLVHQLVRSEYPELVTITKRGCIQVVHYDQQREDNIARERKRELNERVCRQKGFRWIIEALHGSDITGIDLRECAKSPVHGAPIFCDKDEYKAQLHRAQNLIRGNPRVLVGHNCYLDFVYLSRTFIGSLPDTVEDFQVKIHKLWPIIVDTKYMSTHNCSDINPISSLESTAHQLSSQVQPTIIVDKQHTKYDDVVYTHEAGYDSFLTAQIAVRLSSKLEREGAHAKPSTSPLKSANLTTETNSLDHITNGIENAKLRGSPGDNVDGFVTISASDLVPDTNGFIPSSEGKKWKREGEPTLEVLSSEDPFSYNPGDRKHHYRPLELSRTIPGGMPALNSDFWETYGNKLRVFGTEEGVCILNAAHGIDGEGAGVDLSSA